MSMMQSSSDGVSMMSDATDQTAATSCVGCDLCLWLLGWVVAPVGPRLSFAGSWAHLGCHGCLHLIHTIQVQAASRICAHARRVISHVHLMEAVQVGHILTSCREIDPNPPDSS